MIPSVKQTKTVVCLYDRLGVEGSNLSKSAGIKGTESVNIDMSNYKRIKVYGYMNARKYQFCLEIDITDSLNDFGNDNKYWGRATVRDLSLDTTAYLFNVDCSITQDKQTFKVENFGFINLADNSLTLRNSNEAYVVTKIFGIN